MGSNPAGRARFQRVSIENQVILPAVGPLWDLLSTGPRGLDIAAVDQQIRVLQQAAVREDSDVWCACCGHEFLLL